MLFVASNPLSKKNVLIATGVEVVTTDAHVVGQFCDKTDKKTFDKSQGLFTYFSKLFFVNEGKVDICLNSISVHHPHNRERSYSIQTVNDVVR